MNAPTNVESLGFTKQIKHTRPLSLFDINNRWTALICFLIALTTYWVTAMPNIGLNDDGEMATAALHFGVMHPSGYPLWTLLAGIFSHLFPFGNGSWKINLFSGLCMALSAGIFSLISCNASRWLGMPKGPATILSGTFTLTFIWVTPIWSHAVVGKGIYALHVFLMMLLLMLIYLWIRHSDWRNAFVWVVFIFCLGMSNHHMTLSMAFLPLLVILLLHPEHFWEYTLYSLLIASILYLGFAYLSHIHDVWHAAVRLFYTVWFGFILFILIRRKLKKWRQGILLFVAVFLGLLPYAYMPLASSTNPPMNWSYCIMPEGFFYAINRSQYWGTLADQLQSSIGRIMGVPPAEQANKPKTSDHETSIHQFAGYSKVFWRTMSKNITPLPYIILLFSCALCWRFPRTQRIWFYLLVIGFLFSAFLEPITAPNGYDNAGWEMQYQYQSLCYGFFIMLASYGAAMIYVSLEASLARGGLAVILIGVCITLYTFATCLPLSSQRHHWFGWMYGHDMLIDLPKDSFVFGGTDPGRFVPTYMIFGESFETTKRDPSFDRRDLYIITQNALADTFYNRYIRSQYTCERPTTFTWFEHLLGREHTYPKEHLVLPHREEIISLFDMLIRQYQQNPTLMPNPAHDSTLLNSAIAEWIFLHNRDKADGNPRHFYVEESFPMKWSYPYATPHGLCYEIHHNKLKNLPLGTAEKDISWWDNYIKKLMTVPGFAYDDQAHHAFAKLRNTGGNIYAFRHMYDAAEKAYRQALYLWPANSESTSNLVNLFNQEGRFKDARDLVAGYLPLDPNNKILGHLMTMSESKLKAFHELPDQLVALNFNHNNRKLLLITLQNMFILGRNDEIEHMIASAIKITPNDTQLLRDMINFYATHNFIPQALKIAKNLEKLQPSSWDVPFTIAKYELILGQKSQAYTDLHQAVQLGKKIALGQILHEQLFSQIANDPSFQEAIRLDAPSHN